MLDLIIIGGSAAGCSAAIYAARRKLNFKMITSDIGGEVALSGVVENWPGILSIQGFDLAQKFADQVKAYGVEIEEGWTAENVSSAGSHQVVTAKNGANQTNSWEAKTVIIATGIHPRLLSVLGEAKFNRKGVTYCSVCDGPLFKGKTTITVGSGNSALESALMLNGIAKQAYLLSKYPDTEETHGGFPKGEQILIDKVKASPNVKIIYEATTTEIIGENKVSALKYTNESGAEIVLPTDGVMVHIGMTPNSSLTNANKDKLGQIMVDTKCRTSLPGIFAAGDVTDVPYKQIGIAAGQGIIAALAAIEYINKWTG